MADALERLVDLEHASSEIYSMAHEYLLLHGVLTVGDISREHDKLLKVRARVNQCITDIRITLNEGRRG